PFADLQALPRDGKAISSWPDRDEALMNVAQGVREEVQKQASRKKQSEPESPVPNGTVVPRTWWNRKAKRVCAATALPVALASVWVYFSNHRFTLPEDTTVESKLE